jgi:anti-sigma regulatory factor (Ser/Thr protein kinase)
MNIESNSFEASVDSLEPIRDFISEKAISAGLNKKKNYGLNLAIDEIATNIIRYGYPAVNINDGKITVIISVENNQLKVVLEDTALAFDPMKHLLPTDDDINKPLEERPIGGLGIMLARQNVDKYEYEFIDGKNRNIFINNIT